MVDLRLPCNGSILGAGKGVECVVHLHVAYLHILCCYNYITGVVCKTEACIPINNTLLCNNTFMQKCAAKQSCTLCMQCPDDRWLDAKHVTTDKVRAA